MKTKNGLVMTLVISALLIISTFGGIAIDGDANEESLEVVKEVWDGAAWVDEIDAYPGDTVQFKITVTYYNVTQPQYPHHAKNIIVNDTLPDCFEYVPGSAQPDEPDVSGNLLTWDLGSTTLYHEESYVITFNASIPEQGCTGEKINHAEAEADEVCTGEDLYGEDDATVNVIQLNPDIDVEKYVLDGCEWVEEVYADYCTDVTFKIVVENTGEVDLINVYVNDTLPDSLEYNNSATVNGEPLEPTFEDDIFYWFFQLVEVDEIIEIQFKAHVIGDPCDEDINWAEVIGETECGQVVEDEDSATVYVNGMCVLKEVWDEDSGEWAEETTTWQGDTVSFKITITYFGDLVLKDIQVEDQLPECLEYVEDSATVDGTPYEPEISGDGKTLWWNLSEDYVLHDGESLEIEFDAYVSENNCQPCINWAYITAVECGINPMEGEDSATVYIECAFIADAGGPYYGQIGEDIEITGEVYGGTAPFTFEWDLDDDGEYDDATGETVYESWDESGTYEIALKVTDDDSDLAFDETVVIIAPADNNPPDTPSKPDGPPNGKMGVKYTYTTSTEDPDGDQVSYKFDWGDGTNSGWSDLYDSGATSEASHIWASQGSFEIKVKAKDIYGAESGWSDPLTVTMPRNRIFSNPVILKFLEGILQKFPLLRQIFGL